MLPTFVLSKLRTKRKLKLRTTYLIYGASVELKISLDHLETSFSVNGIARGHLLFITRVVSSLNYRHESHPFLSMFFLFLSKKNKNEK